MSALERGLLIFSAQLMTQMIGLRFLTDYLQGDTYFKTRRKEQNLDRARRQLKMVQEIITQQEEIDKRIRPYSGNQNLQWNQRNRTYWQ
ncbi:MAG: hypothetical protein GY757_41320 [bacterium]|nr:hypothetical protein [bacterium]